MRFEWIMVKVTLCQCQQQQYCPSSELALVDLKSLQIVLISYQFERNPHDILEFFVMSTNDTNIYDRVDISFFFILRHIRIIPNFRISK